MAMLPYWSTSLISGFSPAELLMSRRLCANLPIIQSQLQPDFSLLKAREKERKRNQKRVLDSWHAVLDLDPLFLDEVWVPDHNVTGHVIEPTAPTSYRVSIPTGIARRIHAYLWRLPTSDDGETFTQIAEPPSHVNPQSSNSNSRVTVAKSGCASIFLKWWIAQTTLKGRCDGEH